MKINAFSLLTRIALTYVSLSLTLSVIELKLKSMKIIDKSPKQLTSYGSHSLTLEIISQIKIINQIFYLKSFKVFLPEMALLLIDV